MAVVSKDGGAETPLDEPTPGALLAMYATITARRATYDSLMWQVPVLGLTAQAFLMTIGLASDSSRAARLISGTLAFALACLSIQTMHKWRRAEVVDSKIAEILEERLKLNKVVEIEPHAKLGRRAEVIDDRRLRWLDTLPSHLLWLIALGLFAIAGVVIVLSAVLHWTTFS